MDIARIWMSQRNLKRAGQNLDNLPKITLFHCEDDEIQVQDGHHRLVAYWLSGRKKLLDHEYELILRNQHRLRCGKIEDLIERTKNSKTTIFRFLWWN